MRAINNILWSHAKVLKDNLLDLLQGGISKAQLFQLIHISRSIAQSHLAASRSSILHLCLQEGLTITDLSYDAIAEAFTRDEENNYVQLQNFISSLRESLEDIHEREVFLAYKSFIMRVADAQLARLYAQTDPSGAKIHRNIRDCLKHSTLFVTTKDFRGYVLRPLETDALDHLERFPLKDLERQFLSVARANHTTHELIEHLHSTVVNQTHYRRTIPLIEVVYLFKKIFVNELESVSDETWQPPVEELSDFEIENIRNQVEIAIKKKYS